MSNTIELHASSAYTKADVEAYLRVVDGERADLLAAISQARSRRDHAVDRIARIRDLEAVAGSTLVAAHAARRAAGGEPPVVAAPPQPPVDAAAAVDDGVVADIVSLDDAPSGRGTRSGSRRRRGGGDAPARAVSRAATEPEVGEAGTAPGAAGEATDEATASDG